MTHLSRRSLGATDLPVTAIGLGLAAIGRPGYINLGRADDLGADRSIETTRQRAAEMLDAAVAAGVRYVDAARSYGLAEEFLASWLDARAGAGLPLEEMTFGSKWGYTYVGAWRVDAPVHEVKDHSAGALRRQIAESRAILGRWLRLYQIHSATLESGVLDDTDVLNELSTLRSDGLAVGLSVSGPRQPATILRALDVRVDGVALFQTVQATWNLLEPSAGAALSEAHARGLGVIVKEALANGRLTSRSPESRRALDAMTVPADAGVEEIAMAAALANPWADVVLSGAVTKAQLDGNLAAADLVLTPDDRDRLATLAEPPDEYWRRRSGLTWS
jgi:aryl-alcohol dehydrogenase-like predicted oxidoreductase